MKRLVQICLWAICVVLVGAGCSSNDAATAGDTSKSDTTATANSGKMPSGEGDGASPNTDTKTTTTGG